MVESGKFRTFDFGWQNEEGLGVKRAFLRARGKAPPIHWMELGGFGCAGGMGLIAEVAHVQYSAWRPD